MQQSHQQIDLVFWAELFNEYQFKLFNQSVNLSKFNRWLSCKLQMVTNFTTSWGFQNKNHQMNEHYLLQNYQRLCPSQPNIQFFLDVIPKQTQETMKKEGNNHFQCNFHIDLKGGFKRHFKSWDERTDRQSHIQRCGFPT